MDTSAEEGMGESDVSAEEREECMGEDRCVPVDQIHL